MAKRRQTASVGLYNELIAQAEFAKDPNKIVFAPVMGKGPIDMVVLDIDTGKYQAYDVKSVEIFLMRLNIRPIVNSTTA